MLQAHQWKAIFDLAANSDSILRPYQKVSVSGQGDGFSKPKRDAVAQRAQRMVENHFIGQRYEVKVVANTHPYDLHCIRDGEELHIEVKGTTGDGASVFLTKSEVKHAQENAGRIALYVVSHIVLARSGNSPKASGGDVR